MRKYSVFDAQLGKVCDICNRSSANAVVKKVKKIISSECDITGLSDNDIFEDWKYILFAHNKRVIANSSIPLDYLCSYDDIQILLPEKNIKL